MNTYPQEIVKKLQKMKDNRQLCLLWHKSYKSLRTKIINLTPFLSTPKIIERIFYILNNIHEPKLCKCGCGNPVNNYKVDYIRFHGMKSKEVKNKLKQSYLLKYGVDNPQKSSKIKEKTQKTNIERYGNKCTFLNNDIRLKSKQTIKKLYNVDNVSQSDIIKERKKVTLMNNYGVDHNFKIKNEDGIRPCEKTCLKKYGSYFIGASKEIIEKIKQTNMERYGVDNYFKLQSFIDKNISDLRLKSFRKILLPRITEFFDPLFDEKDYLNTCVKETYKCKKCGNIVKGNLRYRQIPRCLICYPYKNSIPEQKLKDFIRSLNIEFKENDRSIINPLELDIYISKKKIAIEFNGNYFHSEIHGGKDKFYHLNKTNMCQEKDIQLIHIFEDEWIYKQKIVENRLKNIFNKTKYRIYGRKCAVKEIDSDLKNKFLNKYHIQGSDKSSIRLGAFYKNRLIAVMTFGKRRFDKEDGYELMRFCTIGTFNIIGIAGKLLKYFERNYSPTKIISYADRRWSMGNLYKQLGFKETHITTPSFFYMKNFMYREHRLNYQKHKLKTKLNFYNPNISAWENMKANKYDRIWDCGNYVFEKFINN